uniref:BHLH domain-containing protein n=1 Tax=Clastoptera arizonana TaxID=38151 RepID=A0A1B6DZ00_9HEMI
MATIMSSRIKRAPLIEADLKMSILDRDAGFCSAEDDEDLDTDIHSPTDISEDSVEVKVKPISGPRGCKNKRKCVEPRKVGEEVKRRKIDFREESEVNISNPFRPWSHQPPSYPPPYSDQQEPLSLVLKDKDSCEVLERLGPSSLKTTQHRPQDVVRIQDRTKRSKRQTGSVIQSTSSDIDVRIDGEDSIEKSRSFSVESLIGDRHCTSTPSTSSAGEKRKPGTPQQRNYKNMTRERRIEANARERTRVHTISAAFDTLRRAVPAYSHNQKLSKLSVLRIACSYILTLSRVAGNDYSADQSAPSLSECVKNVSKTIQMEGKLRKKKEE